ncbi:ATP-binding protein [Microbacterium halophytorum]|uniref:ATP-binding protein n=1 Tax=Microbacterium halophytorum TaxID=2067568 RepID=UPI000CFC7170|nr:ATP-binding protein [Microbacterium halophytorum]
MWRADQNAAETEPAATASPGDLGVAEPGVEVVHASAHERDRLRSAAAALGGPSPLLHFADDSGSAIDVTTAHPASLPQFITGRSTLLSNLFRDEVAMRSARLAAERITAKHVELRNVRAIDAVRLAVGVATWSTAGEQFTAPVLLRPLGIRRHQSTYELKLYGGLIVNPELVRALREQYGIELDGTYLTSLAHSDGVFRPQPVIDHLRSVARDIATFSVRPRLVISTFADVGRAMAGDLAQLDHPVIDALAGHHGAVQALRGDRGVPDTAHPDERSPASDTLLLDADAEQERVLARIADGQSLVVHTLPGTGGTQTIVNAVGSLVRAGKRVLVVSPRRSTLDGIRHRLGAVGLDGLAVAPGSLRRDLIRAIGRNEKAVQPDVSDIDDALVRLRTVLRDYRRALVREHRALGVSPLDAARRLTKLASLANPPSTTARLGLDALEKLASNRADAARTLTLAARLGEFKIGPDESPWYGVSFASTGDATAAHELAAKLQSEDVPELLERGYELISQTRMRPFSTVDELGEYLRLLTGVRDSLDRFSPSVFERPLADLIKAHTPRRESPNLSGAARRRLKKLAKEYVRPGVHVGDMHKALVRIQHQRTQWQHLVDVGTVPEIPIGLGEVQEKWRRVSGDLESLDGALGRGTRLAAMPVERLVRTLGGLAADSDVFDNIVERAELRTKLADLGLEPLLNELAVRHVDEGRVAEELEFAWWQSALEHLLQADRSLLGANTSVVDKLERDFRLVDEAHASASGSLLAWQLAAQWKIGIIDEPDEATALKWALSRGDVDPTRLVRSAPSLMRTLAPVWICSPYDAPHLPAGEQFDAVIVADSAAIGVAEAAPAIRRARQVVAVGDPVTQRPTPFAVQPGLAPDADAPFDGASLFESLAGLVQVETLTRSYRAGGEDLSALVNEAFYGGEIVSLPWAGSYLGRGSLTVDYVEGGKATPDPETGTVESPAAEVARVVSLVVEHAINRPHDSLMVVSANRRHADRVREAINTAFAGRSDVAEFVSRETSEPLAVLTLEEAVAESRDRVIFTLGYGLTKHGRVLSDFGDLSTPDGERLLTVGMTRARRSMVIVSCIRPSAFDEGRLEYGAATLMSILAGLSAPDRAARLEDLADPLTLALARELRRLGAAVDVDYRGLLPLVAQYGGKAVVVEPDPESRGESLRESLRLRPHVLRRLGWHYVRVHAFDLYSDPAAVAARIGGVLGISDDAPRADGDTQPVDF